jgi:serine protease Do
MAKDYQKSIIETVEKTLPAVVSIAVAKDVETLQRQLYSESYRLGISLRPGELESKLEEAPQDEEGRIQIGGGSGFFIEKNGIVLTNKHVAADPGAAYTVITAKDQKHKAQVLARDPINDVAILKIENPNTNLTTVALGASTDLKLGQTVIAIGNALGQFQNSISTGVISGLSRLINAVTDISGRQERLRGLIQTDAAINPGNSGGPLVTLDGKVIGINTAVVFGAQNIGFAIPIERAKKDLKEIKTHGRIRRPFLGVRYLLLNKKLQQIFNLPTDHGALIINEGIPGDNAVIPGSASDKAGLQEHDIILACNKKKITEKETLEDMLGNRSVGDKVELEILRDKNKFTTTAVLEELRL